MLSQTPPTIIIIIIITRPNQPYPSLCPPQSCDRALVLDPKSVKGLFRKGSAHCSLGEYEAAVEALERAAALDGGDANVKSELAKADKQLKKFRYGW